MDADPELDQPCPGPRVNQDDQGPVADDHGPEQETRMLLTCLVVTAVFSTVNLVLACLSLAQTLADLREVDRAMASRK